MESSQFDALTQAIAPGASRRLAVRALSATALGALATRLGVPSAEAKCKQVGKKCKKGDKCCGGAKCKGKRCRCSNDGQCGNGEVCVNGNCAADPTPCPGGEPTCGGVCCQPGQLCENQVCVNGDLEVNDTCDPDAPGACQTGVCGCFGDNNICTCREATCLPPGAGCLFLKNCCDGFCIGNAQVCSQV
jgi:hypothetical protein